MPLSAARSHSSARPRIATMPNPSVPPLARLARPMQNRGMALEFTASYLKDSVSLLRYYKQLAERAIAQASDADLTTALDRESNSIAIIVKHLAGNMVSRWTDFLTTDGEKPTRNRDAEFEAPPQTRAELMALWEAGWNVCLRFAGGADRSRPRAVRFASAAKRIPCCRPIHRKVAHDAYHVGQIVFIAKHLACEPLDIAHHPARKIRRIQRPRSGREGFAALAFVFRIWRRSHSEWGPPNSHRHSERRVVRSLSIRSRRIPLRCGVRRALLAASARYLENRVPDFSRSPARLVRIDVHGERTAVTESTDLGR